MKRLLLATIVFAFVTSAAPAQQVAPGWRATGEWQCGPVKVISSTDGFGGVDFFVVGAWFDNHYTLRRGQLFYNGVPCAALGDPWAFMTAPRPKKQARSEEGEYCDSCGEGPAK
jgi:hypothetical protein